jgi:hypothetical protein
MNFFVGFFDSLGQDMCQHGSIRQSTGLKYGLPKKIFRQLWEK